VKKYRVLLEMILVMLITALGMFLVPSAKTIFALLPVVYLIIERHLRKRSWSELGFKFKSFWVDLKANWFLFILLGFIIQPLTAVVAKFVLPEYLAHVQSRLPFSTGTTWLMLIPMLAVSLLGEEMTYRTLVQGRLASFIKAPVAILLASVVFAFMHYSPGPLLVVSVDIGMIFIDSLFYGIMFNRKNNLIVVWLAHLLGDIFGLLALALL
jgi:membrane protease YdiL (CAAX protease family)